MTGAWSAVIFWHSLEHVRRPVRQLRHAASLVVPGGMLVVAVPNAASLQARLFGDQWLALDLPRHLVHICPPALLAEIEELGFSVERVSYLRGGQVLFGWLHGLVRQLPGHPDLYDAIRRSEARSRPRTPLAACTPSPRALSPSRRHWWQPASRWRRARGNHLRRGPPRTRPGARRNRVAA